MFFHVFIFCILSFSSLHSSFEKKGSNDPINALWLTWESNPTTTMTIRWISTKSHKETSIEYWETVPYMQKPKKVYKATGTRSSVPNNGGYAIHEITLTDLKQNQKYTFRLRKKKKEYTFRTMPEKLHSPIEFIVGGDLFQSKSMFSKMAQIASFENPRFMLFGGDLAYAASGSRKKPEDFSRWLDWLQSYYQVMVDRDGCTIPLLTTLGNHETNGSYEQTPDEAPLFRACFPLSGRQGYNSIAFSNYLIIFLLNSSHTSPIDGAQAEWLKSTLAGSSRFLHRFAIYHVPAYPCSFPYDSEESRAIRKYWVPLFEEYGVAAAFENHDHLYKRTFLLKKGKKNDRGVMYIGNGCFGASPRKPRLYPPEIFAAAYPYVHFIKVRLSKDKRVYSAVCEFGTVFDSFEQGVGRD